MYSVSQAWRELYDLSWATGPLGRAGQLGNWVILVLVIIFMVISDKTFLAQLRRFIAATSQELNLVSFSVTDHAWNNNKDMYLLMMWLYFLKYI